MNWANELLHTSGREHCSNVFSSCDKSTPSQRKIWSLGEILTSDCANASLIVAILCTKQKGKEIDMEVNYAQGVPWYTFFSYVVVELTNRS